jgi:enoyl-CoA hydratase/carnithine racemase
VRQSRKLYFLGDTIDSATAAELGLVSRVVEDEALHDETTTLARRIAAGSRVAYGDMKRNLFAAETAPLATVIDMKAVAQGHTAGGLVVRSTAGSNRVKHTNSNKAKGSNCSSERHRPRRLPRHRLLRQALHPPQRLLLLPA